MRHKKLCTECGERPRIGWMGEGKGMREVKQCSECYARVVREALQPFPLPLKPPFGSQGSK